MSTTSERFWAKVSGGSVTECWTWTAATDRHGYGRFTAQSGRQVFTHRWAYEELRAEIPEGLHLDHLCRNRACVNPWHLEPVTQRVNVLRGNTLAALKAAQTHCVNGHPFDQVNTQYRARGGRRCATCHRARQRAYIARHRPADDTSASSQPNA